MTWSIANYSLSPSSNTLVNGISVAEGCAPSGINDAIRQIMADIATMVTTSSILIVAAAGTADAITATFAPAMGALTDQTVCAFIATAANATATPTFAPNGLAAHTITKKGGVPLVPGDIPGALAVCFAEYNTANTRWELINPASTTDPWVGVSGTADALTATYAPAFTALFDGMMLSFRAASANATTTPTFAPNGLTARTITKLGGTALAAGDIAGSGHECMVVYNLANTRWELLNPALHLKSVTQTAGDSSTNIATTAFVNGTALTLANNTTAVTQAAWNASTKVATTAYADTQDSYVSAQSIGGGNQTVQDVTASRALNTTYTNSTGRAIVVYCSVSATTNPDFSCIIGGTTVLDGAETSLGRTGFTFIVPLGATYQFFRNAGSSTLTRWVEIR
jgi:hypothetical protein